MQLKDKSSFMGRGLVQTEKPLFLELIIASLYLGLDAKARVVFRIEELRARLRERNY